MSSPAICAVAAVGLKGAGTSVRASSVATLPSMWATAAVKLSPAPPEGSQNEV
jgi:hypothetical protein